jgi:hypothetical protein
LIREAHNNGSLWVPGRDPIPIDVGHPKITAMPYDQDRKSFFIAPLPDLFHKLAQPDQAHNLDELFLGAAAHELTHTRHLSGAMRQIKVLQSRYKFPESFDDNIIEREFRAIDEYKRLYDEEGEHLTKAILTSDPVECRDRLEQPYR